MNKLKDRFLNAIIIMSVKLKSFRSNELKSEVNKRISYQWQMYFEHHLYARHCDEL